jgi:plasmid stabilization system protein ParE
VTYKLTKLAEADLASLVDHSLGRFGSKAASRFVDRLERSLDALARGDFDGPELIIGSRARPVRRWPDVRDLRLHMCRAAILCDGTTIGLEHLSNHVAGR